MEEASQRNFLPKEERISKKNDIGRLMAKGRYGFAAGMKYCYIKGTGEPWNRILVSVPKRLFKRAVKRNLLKRRIREAYRLSKSILGKGGTDIMFLYCAKDIMGEEEIKSKTETILREISARQDGKQG